MYQNSSFICILYGRRLVCIKILSFVYNGPRFYLLIFVNNSVFIIKFHFLYVCFVSSWFPIHQKCNKLKFLTTVTSLIGFILVLVFTLFFDYHDNKNQYCTCTVFSDTQSTRELYFFDQNKKAIKNQQKYKKPKENAKNNNRDNSCRSQKIRKKYLYLMKSFFSSSASLHFVYFAIYSRGSQGLLTGYINGVKVNIETV